MASSGLRQRLRVLERQRPDDRVLAYLHLKMAEGRKRVQSLGGASPQPIMWPDDAQGWSIAQRINFVRTVVGKQAGTDQ